MILVYLLISTSNNCAAFSPPASPPGFEKPPAFSACCLSSGRRGALKVTPRYLQGRLCQPTPTRGQTRLLQRVSNRSFNLPFSVWSLSRVGRLLLDGAGGGEGKIMTHHSSCKRPTFCHLPHQGPIAARQQSSCKHLPPVPAVRRAKRRRGLILLTPRVAGSIAAGAASEQQSL